LGKDKLRRWKEIEKFKNVIESPFGIDCELKDKWNDCFFKNENPIVLELGCGKGEYTVGLAKLNSNKNYIGVDIKGSRMYIGAKEALTKNLNNVGFLRTRIDFIDKCFGKNEIDEIWLTFSDPQAKKTRKRLTSPLFIDRYRNLIKEKGLVHLKTDSTLLYEYTIEEIEKNNYTLIYQSDEIYNELDILKTEKEIEVLNIRTHYEKLFSDKGHSIKYCCFLIN